MYASRWNRVFFFPNSKFLATSQSPICARHQNHNCQTCPQDFLQLYMRKITRCFDSKFYDYIGQMHVVFEHFSRKRLDYEFHTCNCNVCSMMQIGNWQFASCKKFRIRKKTLILGDITLGRSGCSTIIIYCLFSYLICKQS